MDERNSPRLQREVLAPQRTSSGLGVMLVATGAMFFAVASSAFLLRARSHDYRNEPRVHAVRPIGRDAAAHPRPPSHAVIPVVAPTVVEPPGAGACGRAIYEGNEDGTVSVVFGLCPDAPAGVAVDRIVSE